ncbi:MAG: acetyl-CoA decarbonylase/synthase complex subunit alpha/beta [bacterium]|nr:acetyl-CoA decarbonylase/synthase complex subunit alpha/beta [bacterium]
MSRSVATAAIRGAHAIHRRAEEALREAVSSHGEAARVSLPDTAYYLPVIYSMLGLKVQTLGDMKKALARAKELLPEVPTDRLWLPYLGDALDAGMATLFAEEVIEALKYLDGGTPAEGIWLGATSDGILRTQGIKLVDGRMPGFAACVGALPSTEEAVRLARDLQERNILVFMAGGTDGTSMAEQLAEAGVEMNWDTFLVPYGKDITAAVLALGFAARSAMTFGGIQPGGLEEARRILLYNKERVMAFVLALGEVDDEKFATAAGALNFGFPVIADTAIPQILPSGICTFEHVVSNVPREGIAQKAIDVRGLKIKVAKIPIPVMYGPAFEGERVRKGQVAVEFGGKHAPAFEYLRSRKIEEVEDGGIEVEGPDVGDVEEASALPLAIVVDVAGRKMQKDFESILERHIHTFLSEAMGVMHIGQRDIIWIRISRDAAAAGLRLRHLGVILRSKLLNDFPAIVDKVQVTLHTVRERVEALLPEAKAAYAERDERMGAMTDESVDTFYSCQLCQSYAPNHICIITPERLGLCGAYNWLDGKAAHQINPTGANQPVEKGECIDPVKGKWVEINRFVHEKSNRTIESFSAYSAMDDPMTSCGCFECILAILPDANGFMIVNREYLGQTPSGMTFSALAEAVGGGQQTPGFIGIGTRYILSRKFISADGGLRRIVWMTREIRERLGEALRRRCEESGGAGLYDMIADESVTTDPAELVEHLRKIGHPALGMEPLL